MLRATGSLKTFPSAPELLTVTGTRAEMAHSRLTCKERILGVNLTLLAVPWLGSTDRGRLQRSHRSPPTRAQSGSLGWAPNTPGPEGTCRAPQEGASGSSSLNDESPLSQRNKTRLLLTCLLFLRAEGCRGATSSWGPAGVGIPPSRPPPANTRSGKRPGLCAPPRPPPGHQGGGSQLSNQSLSHPPPGPL